MQTNSAGFLESVDQNFRHAMSFLDLPEGLAERIIQCNSTHTVRRGSARIGYHAAKFLSEEDGAR